MLFCTFTKLTLLARTNQSIVLQSIYTCTNQSIILLYCDVLTLRCFYYLRCFFKLLTLVHLYNLQHTLPVQQHTSITKKPKIRKSTYIEIHWKRNQTVEVYSFGFCCIVTSEEEGEVFYSGSNIVDFAYPDK